ncbi:MAG TPA: protease inhibitor I42 family protein [Pyrinomonadaceae bacterium]|jgi:inhibitor of cysteine peptidase
MPDRVLTQADNGGAVEVKQGEVISIRLEENPTTGYRWAVDQTDEQILELQNSAYASAGGGIGGGGARTMSFRAKKTGTAPLRLKYRREWEKDSPQGQFNVTVTVHD